MSRSVAILAFDQMEALDFVGPFEVLSTANRVAFRQGREQPFEVMNAAVTSRITARAGLSILVDRQLREVHEADVVLVPGGVTGDVESNEWVMSWLASGASNAELVASVYTGVFVLAAAGVVTTEEVTTHWENLDELSTRFPDLRVRRDVRWVDQGRVVTGAGISARIDTSLYLMQRLASLELAEATARQMDYDWRH